MYLLLSASAARNARKRGLVVVLNPIRASFLLWLQSSPSNKDIKLRGAGLLPTPHHYITARCRRGGAPSLLTRAQC